MQNVLIRGYIDVLILVYRLYIVMILPISKGSDN
jgi:hypothetical protein